MASQLVPLLLPLPLQPSLNTGIMLKCYIGASHSSAQKLPTRLPILLSLDKGILMAPALHDLAPHYFSNVISTLLYPLTLFLLHRPLCWSHLRAFAFVVPSAWNALPPRYAFGWLPYSLQPLLQPHPLCEGFP